MPSLTRTQYEARSQELRSDLKRWENEWAQAHGGAKPDRQAIKYNASIAGKYKEYNKIRGILAKPDTASPWKADCASRKREPVSAEASAPSKRRKVDGTPSKGPAAHEELMNTPALSRKLFSPAPVTFLGPTPQRDGRVLGLFDLLMEKELGSPSKKDDSPAAKRRSQTNDVQATPQKAPSLSESDSDRRLSRTPISQSKRQLLDTFMTPLKDRTGNAGSKTPLTVSKLQFETPAFLRRLPQPDLNASANQTASTRLRLPRKPFARGLIEIVASLRKVEEEAVEDDDAMEALRDAETGHDDAAQAVQAGGDQRDGPGNDSLEKRLPLGGFDDEAKYDSPVEDALDRRETQLPNYRKKGQKRTTRRVIMKPTSIRRPSTDSASQEVEADDDWIPETQTDPATPAVQDGTLDLGAGTLPAQRSMGGEASQRKENALKKTVRKVNELAHANFRRLKLRNRGAKGGPGYNSKFRRKR